MLLRPCVVIPCFDNPATIADVAARSLAACHYPVLVVDDGSGTPVGDILKAAGIADGRLQVHRFPLNRGKGTALRFAIDWCVRRGYTHMITLDGDGQHYPEEIPLFAEEIRKNPFRLVIGHRRMDSTAPGISHFGRKFSNFWVRYQAGHESAGPVADSQSGFRAYPLFPLQTMRFLTRRYDFEIEVLVRALWRGVEVSSIPIRVLYQANGERVSHFHKLRDNARISLLNTLLVALSLFRRGTEPLPAAAAVALGVFVGCTPFFGFHTPIVLALSVALRLNAVLLWLGTQVSLPPLAPFLAMASIFLGSRILGHPVPVPGQETILEFAKESFRAWLVGSFALGATLGLIAGALAFAVAAHRKKKSAARKNWTGETRGGRFGNAFLVLVLRHMGLRAGYFCLGFVVPYFYLFAPKARRALDEYWRVARPGLGWLARQRRIYLHLRAFARVLMDRIYQLQRGGQVFERTSSGFGVVREALGSGRGILLAGAHAGCFDLAVTALQAHGVGRKMHVLQHEAQRLTMAKAHGEKSADLADIIYVGEENPAVFRVQELLGNGGMLGLMADRPLDHKFVLVPFFGRLAPVATSPFRIALATGCELAFTYGFKGPGRTYEYSCVRPAPLPPGVEADRDLAAYHYAREYARLLEEKLEQHPEQWFNFYRFFSALPTLPTGERCQPRQCRLLAAEEAR